jgi:ribose transport system permease protein
MIDAKQLEIRQKGRAATVLRDNAIYFIVVGIFIIFAKFLWNKGFLSFTNIMNIFRQTAPISILAIGFTYLLASGEFDLSIGSTVALGALVGALVLQMAGVVLAVLAALALGAFIGIINGAFVVKTKMPSFLATIATQIILYGFARWITHLQAVPVTNKLFYTIFGGGNVGPISTLFIWTIVCIAIGHTVITKTSFGRKVLATGGNKTAAVFSGINVNNIKWSLFILMGILAALTGLLYAGRLHAARYTYGEADLFTVVAAVVIGGNSIYGGKGTVVGALIGSVILGMINNGLILFGLSVDQQLIFRGVIILAAVALSPKET